jgi:hypothetical protein
LKTQLESQAKFEINGHIYNEKFIVCDDLLFDIILSFEWCKKHKIWVEYLNNRDGIHKTPRIMVNRINSNGKTGVALVKKNAEFFKPLVMAAHRGDIDFSITLKREFCLHPTRPTMLTVQQQKLLRTTVDNRLRDGMITPFLTEFASPVVIVKEKDGTDRICIDFCELNSLTVRDIYPFPVIEIMQQNMRNFRLFSKIDLPSAYHQIRATSETEYILFTGVCSELTHIK